MLPLLPQARTAPLHHLTRQARGKGQLRRLMDSGALHCVFQPIADLTEGTVFAHEALIRGPTDTPFQSPDALLALAHREGLMMAFELHCVDTALAQWGQSNNPGRLFINVSADALVHACTQPQGNAFADLLQRHGVKARHVVLELTEHERVNDMAQLRDVAKTVHAMGLQLALDDFGDGRSSLRLWSEIRPDFVKIDKYFAQGISRAPDQLQVVRAVREIANVFGTALLAEGIETGDDLRVLRDMGLRYGQGYFLGRPQLPPQHQVLAQAAAVLADCRVAVMPQLQHPARPGIMRNMAVISAPVLRPSDHLEDVAEEFQRHPDLHALAVVDEQDRPLGLINRQGFMSDFARLYYREIHGRKPVLHHANLHPRIIERDFDVEELVGILTSQDQRYLADGFIVTDNGRYVGLGTGDQLVRSVTEARIEAARHANPLTFLPGNIPITQHIQRLLDTCSPFVAAYVDLNHFKPFNDQYGYWRGDEMIRLAASIVTRHCAPQHDFVGHVGGDDFIVLFQSTDWAERCRLIIDDFRLHALGLFDESARLVGGIHAEDRHGVKRFFPCTTLAIGAVTVASGLRLQAEDVANQAALAKHDAKLAPSGISVRQALVPAPSAGPVTVDVAG
ncbi:MAG: phosphodiesterase [Burkholderiaceae bacterium]|nr:phosphodiesterase [Burkholderiaceae bacterium]MDZ4161517.1 phosphodiesterase [Burkholderiales bacterium]